MTRYEFTPAETAHPPALWPSASALGRDSERPMLLMFLHPRCPCSRASLAELEILAAQAPAAADVRLIFVRPEGAPDGWERGRLWDAAAAVPGARLVADDGREAACFHATASGETLLYGADGRLLFHGGLTASRGHSGDNAGRDALTEWLTGGKSACAGAPVYGCFLNSDGRPCGGSACHVPD